MKKITTIATLAFAASAAACAAAPRYASSPQRVALACNQLPADSQQIVDSVLTPGATFDAKPLTEIRVLTRASEQAVLVGAQVRLPAPPNVSKEYLERVLTCHANSNVASNAADPFRPAVGSVSSVDVKSEGATLAVQIRGSDKFATQDILERAELLTAPSTDVTVQQVGLTTTTQPF